MFKKFFYKTVNRNVTETFFVFGYIWLNKSVTFRSNHQRCSTAILLKKRLWHRHFPVNFVKFLRIPFSQNTSGRLLLYVLKKYLLCTLSKSRLVQTRHYYLLYYFEVKQIEAIFRRWNFYLQLYYRETLTQVFFWEICEIFKNTFFHRTTPVAASEQIQEISVVHCVAKWCCGHLAQVCLSYPISCENC